MKAQDYFEQYADAKRIIIRLQKEYESEMEILDSICSSPHYRNLYQDDSELIKARVNARKLQQEALKYSRICDEIEATIEQIPGIKGEILYERYINCAAWEQIADRVYYSLGYVQRLHRQALEELQSVIDNK